MILVNLSGLPSHVGTVSSAITLAAAVNIVCLSLDLSQGLKAVWNNCSSTTLVTAGSVLHFATHNIIFPTGGAVEIANVDSLFISTGNSFLHLVTAVTARHWVVSVYPAMPHSISMPRVFSRAFPTNKLPQLFIGTHRHDDYNSKLLQTKD